MSFQASPSSTFPPLCRISSRAIRISHSYFLVTNQPIDLIADNIEVAVRVGQLNDLTILARRIAGLTQVVCASFQTGREQSITL
jgi:hypothetical protein